MAKLSHGSGIRLFNVFHYHQAAGVHPRGSLMEHDTACIELVTGGRGWVQIEGRWVEVGPGDLLWHSEGDLTISRNDFEDPYRCLAIRFRVEKGAWPVLRRLSHWSELDEVKRLTQEAVALFVDERFSKEHLGEYLLSRLAFQVRLYEYQQRNETLPVQLRRVLARIESDYTSALTMRELALEAGWSEPHLHVMFRQYVKQTPHQHLLERRIRAAKEHLSSSNAPIKQIAVDCGFSSDAAFCAIFRRMSGNTPAAYRREQHQWLGAARQ